MNVDPAAAMRCWAVDVEVAGSVYTIPPLPAADWWSLLADGGPAALIDLLPEGHDLDDRFLDEASIAGELESAFLDTVEQATGRPFKVALTIVEVARGGWWVIGGKLAQRGFRWDVMPIAAALDAIHLLIIESLPEDARKKYEAAIEQAGRDSGQQRAVSDFESIAGPMPTAVARRPVESTGAPSGDARSRIRPLSQPPRPRDRSGAPTTPLDRPAGSGRSARSGPPSAVVAPAS